MSLESNPSFSASFGGQDTRPGFPPDSNFTEKPAMEPAQVLVTAEVSDFPVRQELSRAEKEFAIELAGYSLSASAAERICKRQEVKAAWPAFIRTAINLGITLSEWIPLFGQGEDAAVDFVKVLKLMSKHFKSVDPTPEVSGRLAIGLDLGKFATCGFLPAHAVESFLQLRRKDWPLIRQALGAMHQELKKKKAETRDPRAAEAADKFRDK